jgi:hypothetical protein
MKQKGKVISLVGRVLFSLIFVTAAPRHFTYEGIQHAADLGVTRRGNPSTAFRVDGVRRRTERRRWV